MFSTKFWFTLVTLVMGSVIALLLLARNAYNEAREEDTQRLLLKDRAQAWALLKSEARVRLDVLLRVSADPDVLRTLHKASVSPSKLTSDDRDRLSAALRRANEELKAYRGDLLVAVDRQGKAVAQVWENGPSKLGYYLDGFPAVNAALRGFLQDDIWAISTDPANPNEVKVYRIAARPVISAGRYVGAIVHGQLIDTDFANTLSKRLGARVIFFRGPVVIAAGSPAEGSESTLLAQSAATPLQTLLDDDEFLDRGRSGVISLGQNALAVYSLAMGEASLVDGSNVGYAIVREVPTISSTLDIITAASLEEWKALLGSATGIGLIVILVLVLAVGFLFFYLEHGRPLRKLRREVDRLAAREVDRLNIYAVTRLYRSIAESINKAMDKAVADVAEKLGKSSASIDAILGPSQQDDRVSSALFTFPDAAEEVPPPPPGPPEAPPSPPAAPAKPPAAGPQAVPPAGPAPAMSPTPAGAPPASAPAGSPREQAAPPMPPSPAAPGPVPAAPPPPAGGVGASPVAPSMQSVPSPNIPSFYDEDEDDEDEDKTEIAGVPAELLAASRGEEADAEQDETAYFREIFEQFVATKRQCGERTDSLQFERFSQTLRRNRDALVERYGCKTVRFQVYVKEGKAALKAIPVKN